MCVYICLHICMYIHTRIYVCVCVCVCVYSYYGLSQDIESSSLCYTVGPCCLSILYIIGCIC